MKYAIKTIKLSQLFLNTENYRFEITSSQKESINLMVSDQKEKLYNLAEDIVKYGLNPTDMIIVSPKDDVSNEYIVLEGNRRITALKLLSTPSLIIDDYLFLRKKFSKLQDDNKNNILTSIDCIVFDSIEDADIWIKRKHSGELNGVGTVTWNAQQKQRYDEKIEGKTSIPLQIISFLKTHESVSDEIKESLPKVNISNLERLISDPYVREKIGLQLNNGILSSKFNTNLIAENLINILTDVISPTFKVADIYKSSNRKEYVDSKSLMPLDDSKSEISWELKSYKSASKDENFESKDFVGTKDNGNNNKLSPRKTLIPKNFNLVITKPKHQRIFKELKSLLVYNHPNAAGIMLRVFIEISVDAYIENQRLLKENVLTSSSTRNSLESKVFRVLNHLTLKGLIDENISKGIRTELKDSDSIISIDTLNAYVHNSLFYTKADNIITGWDLIQPFVEILWNNIDNK